MPEAGFSTTKNIINFEGTPRSDYWRRFTMLMTLSVVIATMGLLRNSGPVVIAAMLIAPLMTPILGIAAAMVMGRTGRALRLTCIVLIAAAGAVGLALLTVIVADIPPGVIPTDEVLARTDPGIEDLVVALASGIAGAYVQIQKKELSLLPGAAIGVSLVPPLSAAGVLTYYGAQTGAIEALLLFATNLAAIVLSACVVYVAAGSRSVIRPGGKRTARFTASVGVTVLIFCAIVFKLASDTRTRYLETRAEVQITRTVQEWAGDVSVEILRVDADVPRREADLWMIVDIPVESTRRVTTVAELVPPALQRQSLTDLLFEALGTEYEITVRFQFRVAGTLRAWSSAPAEAEPAPTLTDDLDVMGAEEDDGE